MGYALTFAEYNYSSWSMRPWLVLKHIGIAFEEKQVKLNGPGIPSDEVRKASPSGKVPIFDCDGRLVWESLAICELLSELFPSQQLWPRDRFIRAFARSVATEMVAGFAPLRAALPMNIRARVKHGPLDEAVQWDITRIQKIWNDCVEQSGGPFLFGVFGIADAMYAPVVTRFRSYGVEVNAKSAEYMKAIEALPTMQLWKKRAEAETAEFQPTTRSPKR